MRWGMATLLSVLLLAATAGAADESSQASRRNAMVTRIDAVLKTRWSEEGITPSPLSDDAEFLRRIYLDLTGVIPKVAEVRQFLNDQSPDKRAELIDRLLASPSHATHMANTWRSVMLPGNLSLEQRNNVAGVQNWLRSQFVENMRYDRMVGDLIVATGSGATGPGLYYTALELKPEKLAASTSRIFLGLQIDCAECHDHPFDHWTQEDFWGYAAFFAQLRDTGNSSLADEDRGDVMLPDTETIVPAKFPGGVLAARDGEFGSRRDKLAVWISSRSNHYLPKAAVNRLWAHLFGRGLVDPVDDLGQHNPPSHPQLFDELSTYFVKSGYDLRELLRTLTNTRAYQLSSRVAGEAPPRELFSAMAIKPLTAEQLYDSINRSLGRRQGNPNPLAAGSQFDQQRLAFVAKMQSQARDATEYDAGVTQALTLMNGMEVTAATDLNQSRVLTSIEAPFFSDQERLDVLYMSTVARLPDRHEREEFMAYLGETAETRDAKRAALADILWALLNSAEFALNH